MRISTALLLSPLLLVAKVSAGPISYGLCQTGAFKRLNRLALAITLKVYACRMQHSRCGLLCCRRIYFRDRRRRSSYTRRYPCLQLGARNLLGDLRDAGFARSHSMISFVSHPSLFSYLQSYCYCCWNLVRGLE